MTSTEEPEDAIGTKWRIQGHCTLLSFLLSFLLVHCYIAYDENGTWSQYSFFSGQRFISFGKLSTETKHEIWFPPKLGMASNLSLFSWQAIIKQLKTYLTGKRVRARLANSSVSTDIQYQSPALFISSHTLPSQDRRVSNVECNACFHVNVNNKQVQIWSLTYRRLLRNKWESQTVELSGRYLDYVIRPDGVTSGYSKNYFRPSLITNDQFSQKVRAKSDVKRMCACLCACFLKALIDYSFSIQTRVSGTSWSTKVHQSSFLLQQLHSTKLSSSCQMKPDYYIC